MHASLLRNADMGANNKQKQGNRHHNKQEEANTKPQKYQHTTTIVQ